MSEQRTSKERLYRIVGAVVAIGGAYLVGLMLHFICRAIWRAFA